MRIDLEQHMTEDEREQLATLRAFAALAWRRYRGYRAKIKTLTGRARKRAERNKTAVK